MFRTRALAVAALASTLLWPFSAAAYRPFNGTDAAVAARSELQVELAPIGFIHEGPDRTLVAPSANVSWGFADRNELVLEGRHFVQLGNGIREPRFRVEDIALSLKTVLRQGALQEKTGASVASEVSALLPTVNGGGGAGAELAVIVSQRWPELIVHLNGAAAWTRAHRLGLFGGAIVEVHDAWALRPVAEVFIEGEHELPRVVSGLVGAIWRVRDALSLDAGVRLARGDGVTTTELRAGVTWGFDVGLPR